MKITFNNFMPTNLFLGDLKIEIKKGAGRLRLIKQIVSGLKAGSRS